MLSRTALVVLPIVADYGQRERGRGEDAVELVCSGRRAVLREGSAKVAAAESEGGFGGFGGSWGCGCMGEVVIRLNFVEPVPPDGLRYEASVKGETVLVEG